MAKTPSKPDNGTTNSSSAANQNPDGAPPSSASTANSSATAVQQTVRGAPYTTLTFSNQPQQLSAADLGITLPGAGTQNGTSPSPLPPTQVPGPATVAPTAATTGTTASAPLSRRGSARLAAHSSGDNAAGKKNNKSVSPTKSSARAGDDTTPRDDALLTLISDTRDRQATVQSQISSIGTDSAAAAERARRQHEATTRQLADAIRRLEAQQADIDLQRRDMDRAIAKIGRLESRSGAPGDDSVLANMEADQSLLRQQTNELLDGYGMMRVRQDTLERNVTTLLEQQDANSRAIAQLARTAERTQLTLERMERALAAPPPPYPVYPASTSTTRRRSVADLDGDDERASSFPRLSIPTSRELPPGLISHPYRPPSPLLPPAEINAAGSRGTPAWAQDLMPDMLSAVVGAAPHMATLNWGGGASDAISRLQLWTGLIEGVGIVPKPIHAAQPAGMPDNYRLFTFNSHNDLIAFLTAWDRRAENFQAVGATPSADVAQPRGPSTAALGLLPPRSGPDNGRGRGGPRDSNGRRPF